MDKRTWGPGPWQSEPDAVEWVYRGLRCLIRRSPIRGNLCGYVGFSPGHPLSEVGYSDSMPQLKAALERQKTQPLGESPSLMVMIRALCGVEQTPSLDTVVDVHGGITFSGRINDDLWWIGFDCGHAGDYSPAMVARMDSLSAPLPRSDWGAYRDLAFVRSETESLADQLLVIADELAAANN